MIELVLLVDWPLEELWSTAEGFIVLMCIAVGAIGLGSKSMTVSSFAAYILFIYYAINLDSTLLTSIAYVSLTVVCAGLGFKLLRAEGPG